MAHEPKDTDPRQWHRFFAVEYNNRAWALAGAPRTSIEDAQMLDAAHAAAAHWAVVGTQLNHMRATMLLAHVHALLGRGASAMAYAREMHAYFLANDTPDWEVAFTHAIHAGAAHANGEEALYRASYAAAVDALEAIADAEDRAIVMQTFTQIPRP